MAQERPRCLKTVDSKIKTLDKMTSQMQEYAYVSDGRRMKMILKRNKSIVRSSRKSLSNCQEKSGDGYDYTQISTELEESISQFEALSLSIDSVIEENEKQKKAADLAASTAEPVEPSYEEIERENQRNYRFKTFLSFVNEFPRVKLSDEDRKEHTIEDTQNILNSSEGDRTDVGRLKQKYKDALETINSKDFENRVYAKIDFEYSRIDQQDALKELREHLDDFEFVNQSVFPNNPVLVKIEEFIEKLVSKKQTAKAISIANILVSDFHGTVVNKIVFTSNLSLNPETASAGDFNTDFEAGQSIKAIAYLDNTYHNIYGRTNRPTYRMLGNINSGQIIAEGFQKNEGAKPYVVLYLSQDGDTYKAAKGRYPGTAVSMEHLSSLSPRTHKIKVKLNSYLGNAQGDAPESDIIGTFSFDASDEGGLAKMKMNIVGIRDKSLASVDLPKAGMSNGKYEASLITLFNAMGWEEKFTKAIIGSGDFGYKKNYLDQVVGRTLQVYMVSKKGSGGCMYQDFTVIQEKVGSNWSAFKRLSTGSQKDISCSKI